MTVGEYLRELRVQNGWTQAEAGERSGLALSTISAYERDTINIASDKIEKLASVYGVSPGDIMNAGLRTPDIFKTLKITIADVRHKSQITNYKDLPNDLKALIASAALDAVAEYYNSLPNK